MNNGSSSSAGRVQLLFEFHSARKFTSLTLHLARAPVSDIKSSGLTACLVNLAVDNGNYLGKTLRHLVPDNNVEPIYNITVDLKGRIAKFLQLELQFNSRWLLVSEVTFQSELSDFNVTDQLDYSDDEVDIDQSAVASHNPAEEEGPEIPIIDDEGDMVDDSFEEISTGK